MWIANINLHTSDGFVKAGQEINPTPQQIAKGLVREVKIIAPEVKDADPKPTAKRTRKPRNIE